MESYRDGVRRFLHMLLHEPHVLIGASLLCLLFTLPVLPVGVGVAAALHYCACCEQGRACGLRQALRETRHLRGRAFLMGLLDLLAGLCAAATLGLVLSRASVAVKASACVLFYLDVSFLASALFRYPALVRGDLPLARAIHTGVAVCMANVWQVLLYWCVALLLLMLCAASGIGVLLLFPGAICMLLFTSWNSVVRRYRANTTEHNITSAYDKVGAAQEDHSS